MDFIGIKPLIKTNITTNIAIKVISLLFKILINSFAYQGGVVLSILLFSLGLIIGLSLLYFDTYIHEYGHVIAVKYFSKINSEFAEELYYEICPNKNPLKSTTKSNYLAFLSKNRDNKLYHTPIRITAIMGCLFSSLLYIIISSLIYIFLIPVSELFYIFIGILVAFTLIELLTFFFNDNSETSDFYIAKYPEEYIYRY